MITPVSGLALELGATTPDDLAKAYGPWSGIRSNHVITQSGEFSGLDGSSRSISTDADRELLLALRSMAEVIMVDAATARKERYLAPRSGARLAIFSSSGNFDEIPAVALTPERVLLFAAKAPAATASNYSARLKISHSPLTHFQEVSEELGIRSVLLEAGPTLSKHAFELGLVAQSALTITPALANFGGVDTLHPFDSNARMQSRADSPGASFTYWQH